MYNMAETLSCPPETTTTLLISSTPTQNVFVLKKRFNWIFNFITKHIVFLLWRLSSIHKSRENSLINPHESILQLETTIIP